MSNAVLRSVSEHGVDSAPSDETPARRSPSGDSGARYFRWILPAMALVVALAALALLHRELAHDTYHAVARAVRRIPRFRIWRAVGITALCYTVLFGYDWLALRYVGRRLAAKRTALASFIAHAFGQSLGMSAVTSGSVRFRFWSAWGLAPREIVQGIAFTTVTFWLGILTTVGLAVVAGGAATFSAVPVSVPRWAGVILLLPGMAYAARSFRPRPPLRLWRWAFPQPRFPLAAAQIALATLDWTLAGCVLYVLLPKTALPLDRFLLAFVVAQVAGVISHLPGGIGVFDSIMLAFLQPFAGTAESAAALVAYRATYYLVPLGAASLAFAAHELALSRRHVVRAMRLASRAVAASAPYWLSGATFAAGALLLASGSTPSVHSRLRWLDDILPLGVIELSHFTASIAGVVLLLVANGLRRRLDAAWHLAVATLAVSVGASLLKGADYEEAITLGIVLAAVWPSRRYFYRRAALLAEPLTPGWSVAVLVAVTASTWLGFFSYRHLSLLSDRWWEFAVTADASRFLRATVGVAVVLIAYAGARLLRPSRVTVERPSADELERARSIVADAPVTDASLALLGDKALLFSQSGRGLLMYGVRRNVWVALGDPVASPDEARELAWRFCELADAHGARPAFYEVGVGSLPLYVELGFSMVKIGEEARVPLADFSLEGGARKRLRRIVRDGDKAGLTFEIVQPPFDETLWEEIEAVSDAWLEGRRTREKGFSLGFFDRGYLEHFPLAVIRSQDRVTGFANLWVTGRKEELSVDLMRHAPGVSSVAMDYLFVQLMLWGREQGYGWFNLGMAPLSGFETRALAPLWSRLGGLVYRHAEHFYNFRGLRQYKEKFDPVWAPRYVAARGAWSLPLVLTSVTSLIGSGLKGAVAK